MYAALSLEWLGYLGDRGMFAGKPRPRTYTGPSPLDQANGRRPSVLHIRGYSSAGVWLGGCVSGRIDYQHANSAATRGVMLHFLLAPGLHEITEYTSWRASPHRRLALSQGGTVTNISRKEALEWLEQNANSGSG